MEKKEFHETKTMISDDRLSFARQENGNYGVCQRQQYKQQLVSIINYNIIGHYNCYKRR